MSNGTPAWSGSSSVDQAIAGIGAGVASTLAMQPLDLLKVKFQVSTASSRPSIYASLNQIVKADGFSGLYRGLGVNMFGNSASWGFYFLWYTMLKDRALASQPGQKLNAGQHLLASGQAGVASALATAPIWVVKTRMFTTRRADKLAYRNVFDGLYRIGKYEGLPGLYKGTLLGIIGVSNGAVQFMAYEELKKYARERKMQRGVPETEAVDLSNSEYIVLSGSAKLFAILCTYPYQVIRSRLQYQRLDGPSATADNTQYRSMRDVILRTYREEGLKAFYKGLAPNAVRILPGTCVTFVVYENISAFLRNRAQAAS